MVISYRNQSADVHCKPIDSFLYVWPSIIKGLILETLTYFSDFKVSKYDQHFVVNGNEMFF